MEHREGRFDPDPLDRSILALQDRHRSQLVDSGQLNQVLTCRQRLWTFMREWEMDPRIRRYVMQSGFYGVYRVGHISLDWPLITSLVERWRPETHTFHLPIGEMTVTLQDVAMILGLRIHGPPITGTCDIDWSLLCSELLGVVPPPSQIRGSSISARWLREQFSYPPAGVDDVILQRYARAFILALLGGALFADKTGTHVQLCYLPLLRDFTEISHYSWGSAVLAYLYRELCRASLDSATEISGPITLLQLWSWERLHVGRPDFGRPPVPIVVPHVHDDVVDGLHDHLLPDEALPIDPLGHRWRVPLSWSHNPSPHVLTFYRDQLDAQTQDQVLWEPYTADLIAHLPAICQADEEIWRTMSPLICFDIIEWHRPERVLRQFHMQQGIPPPCLIDMELHLVDRRGRHQYDWVTFHAQYISLWATRSERIATAPLAITTMSFYDPYMQWYRRITRRLIAPVLHRDHMRFHSTASATELLITAVSQMAISNDLEETHRIAIDVLRAIGEDHRLHSTHEPSTSSGSSMRPPSLITPVRVPPIRGRGRGGRRAGHRHVPLASTLVQPSHPPVTSTFPLFQPSASLESPLSPPDVSIPAYSPRPETTIPSTLTPVQPSISLDAPPPIAESIAPPPVTESIAPPPVTESIAPLPFLQGIAHAARLHVRVPRGHRAPRVRRVLPPSVPSISTAHVDDVSQSIEMETFQIAQMDTTNMAIYRRCSQRKRKIPSCGTH
ncbi:Serine/threonine-protein phosphatase 7 long form-like [Vitis vinifera]|nr:Serine/threonine-protein phosphatase 7 long form-like [Vitis vinifera]